MRANRLPTYQSPSLTPHRHSHTSLPPITLRSPCNDTTHQPIPPPHLPLPNPFGATPLHLPHPLLPFESHFKTPIQSIQTPGSNSPQSFRKPIKLIHIFLEWPKPTHAGPQPLPQLSNTLDDDISKTLDSPSATVSILYNPQPSTNQVELSL